MYTPHGSLRRTTTDIPTQVIVGGFQPPSAPGGPPIPIRAFTPETVIAAPGDTIRFTVSSDQSDEVHVHGYDLEKPVGPGAPARFSFSADADGIFEVELHGSGAQIASLEVQPG